MNIQDPNRQISYLQQCLSTDKKPLGIFLGAGCPMAIRVGAEGKTPLIPDVSGMTRIVRDGLTKCEICRPLLEIVEEHFEKDGLEEPNLENMLTHIRSLRIVAGKDEVRGLSAENLNKLDENICKLIHQVVDKNLPNFDTPYHSIAKWVDAVRRENPIEVFTTNYDLLIEQAFEDSRVPYFDGFAGIRNPFFDLRAMEEDMLPPRWARLWKLHGSINWYQEMDKAVFRGTAKNERGSKRVIHPSHLKYQESRRLPYLAMMDRLRAFLKQSTSALILCGYSFRDEHINEIIVQGLQATQTAIGFGLLFGHINDYKQAIRLASNCSNLNILARDGGVIGGQQFKWPEMEADSVPDDKGSWVKWNPINRNGGRCSIS